PGAARRVAQFPEAMLRICPGYRSAESGEPWDGRPADGGEPWGDRPADGGEPVARQGALSAAPGSRGGARETISAPAL
ncbi:hypothetical protein, partial [Klebsiella oxytoca]|uniref:hypothetical protein n=1 Tax=Klebsiella oxytoca TaxID=571 RepID=UPI0022B543D8